MKADTHPDYHMIKVQMTDGTVFETRSTWGKEGDTMTSTSTRPATRPGPAAPPVDCRGGRVAQFNKRFGGLSLKKKDAKRAFAHRVHEGRSRGAALSFHSARRSSSNFEPAGERRGTCRVSRAWWMPSTTATSGKSWYGLRPEAGDVDRRRCRGPSGAGGSV